MTNATVTPLRNHIPAWTFADRLRKVRREILGTTIEGMAEALEVGSKAYGAWEAGRNKPGDIAAIATKLEQITGVPRTWFLGWTDDAPVGGGSNFVGGAAIRPRLVGRTGLEPVTDGLWVAPVTALASRRTAREDRSAS